MEVALEMRPIFVQKILYDTKFFYRVKELEWNPTNCQFGLCSCMWLRYGSGFENAPFICKKAT